MFVTLSVLNPLTSIVVSFEQPSNILLIVVALLVLKFSKEMLINSL